MCAHIFFSIIKLRKSCTLINGCINCIQCIEYCVYVFEIVIIPKTKPKKKKCSTLIYLSHSCRYFLPEFSLSQVQKIKNLTFLFFEFKNYTQIFLLKAYLNFKIPLQLTPITTPTTQNKNKK